MVRFKNYLLLMLGCVTVFTIACGGDTAVEPILPDGPALVIFYTDG